MLLSQKQRDTRKLWEMVNMTFTLIVVMASWEYAYVQTLQIIHIKYV